MSWQEIYRLAPDLKHGKLYDDGEWAKDRQRKNRVRAALGAAGVRHGDFIEVEVVDRILGPGSTGRMVCRVVNFATCRHSVTPVSASRADVVNVLIPHPPGYPQPRPPYRPKMIEGKAAAMHFDHQGYREEPSTWGRGGVRFDDILQIRRWQAQGNRKRG
jgi:hypothetical protein